MRAIFCGDRDWTDTQVIGQILSLMPKGSTIIEGEARGADKLSATIARALQLTVEPYPADWKKYGKGAGPIRNKQMLVEGKPDIVVFFHYDLQQSRGTLNMVNKAIEAGVPILDGWFVSGMPLTEATCFIAETLGETVI